MLFRSDLEDGPWPLAGRRFDLVVVTNYLWRPLLPAIVAAVAPAGRLVYETFAAGHGTLGRPTRADYLLQPAELLAVCAGLQVRGFEQGRLEAPPRIVQRVAADRDPAAVHQPLPGSVTVAG